MFKISYDGLVGCVVYGTEREAARAVHEILEEAFGEAYGDVELAAYEIVPA